MQFFELLVEIFQKNISCVVILYGISEAQRADFEKMRMFTFSKFGWCSPGKSA